MRIGPGAASEVRAERRADERDVGDRFSQCVGDDRRLDSAGERTAGVRLLAQLEPAGVADRLGEAAGSLAVVEVDHRPRSELASQAARGAPQLGLLGGIAGVHRRESYYHYWRVTLQIGKRPTHGQ